MRDASTNYSIAKILQLQKAHSNLVVSQALYKEKNRLQLHKQFPHALFIHIDVDKKTISQRLKLRANEIDEEYANMMASNFEEPKISHRTILNEGSEDKIMEQLCTILS